MALVEMTSVTKSYEAGGDEVQVLRDLSLRIGKGDFIAVMGPSGSGKSTLLSLIGGLHRATSGTVVVDGIDLGSLGPNRLADFRREYLGFVFQSFYLIPYLTALENVMLPLAIQPGRNGTGRDDAFAALEAVGMGGKAGRLPSQLSGGEQERVAIARAIVNRPPLILADEPTGNLDSRTGDQVLGLLEDLNGRGHTIMMVTHSGENARRAHRTIEIRDGKIVAG